MKFLLAIFVTNFSFRFNRNLRLGLLLDMEFGLGWHPGESIFINPDTRHRKSSSLERVFSLQPIYRSPRDNRRLSKQTESNFKFRTECFRCLHVKKETVLSLSLSTYFFLFFWRFRFVSRERIDKSRRAGSVRERCMCVCVSLNVGASSFAIPWDIFPWEFVVAPGRIPLYTPHFG